MAGDTQSNQEILMKTFCGRLMAAPYVFCPDEWRLRHNKRQEPADLAWACNNCIILMYLASSKKHDKAEKNKKKFTADIAHNLSQARGALHTWKRLPITGSNAWHRFSLAYRSTTRIIVLSVVKTGEGTLSERMSHHFAELHEDWAERNAVKMCATIPQFFVETLAGTGGSVLDLLILLNSFRADRIIGEERLRNTLLGYRLQCLQASEQLNHTDYGLTALDERSQAVFAAMCLMLAQTRHRPTAMRGGAAPLAPEENIGAKYGILSDIDLEEYFILAKALMIVVELSRRSRNPEYLELSLQTYDCAICVAQRSSDESYCRATFEIWAAPRKAGTARPGLFFWQVAEKAFFYCYPVTRIGPSSTEQLLDTISRGAAS